MWNGIIIADDMNFHNGSERMPFTKSSTNFLRRPDVDGRPTMSRNSSHVHPSRRGADSFGISVNAYVTTLRGIGKNVVMTVNGEAGTCVCSVTLVSLERKVAATTGSDYVP